MSGDEWQNPIADSESPPASPGSLAETIDLNRCDLSEDELVDLTYAFQAADMSGEGKISFEEFCFLLDVMGCDIGPERTRQLMADAKAGFATWLKTTDKRSRAQCKKAWDNFDTNHDGTMDLNELNAVVAELQKQGFTPSSLSQADLEDGGMGFDDFCAWFIAQDRAGTFTVPSKKMRIALPTQRKKKKVVPLVGENTSQTTGSRQLTRANTSRNMLDYSTNIAKKASNGTTPVGGRLESLMGGNTQDKFMRTAMADPDQMIFAEYAYMIRGNMLTAILGSTEWASRVDDIAKLRQAFDSVDVDANNKIEENELDFMVMSMNVNADISADVAKQLWAVLNPNQEEFIGFKDFAKGMIEARKQPHLKAAIPFDAPNRFELLSLVVDSPTSQAESDMLYQKMNFLEKAGVRVLRELEMKAHEGSYNSLKAKQHGNLIALERQLRDTFDTSDGKEFSPGVPESIDTLLNALKERHAQNLEGLKDAQAAVIKSKVMEVCEGKLHFLTPQQRWNVTKLHYYCVVQAVCIGAVCTVLPGLLENFLCYYFETDGAIDAYWTCPFETRGSEGGGRGADVGSTEWIGGSYLPPFDEIAMPVCPYGTCASIPEAPLDVFDMDGSVAFGGRWTNLKVKLTYQCTIANPWPEDCPVMAPEDCADRPYLINSTCPEEGQLRARVRQKPCALSKGWRWCNSAIFGDHVGLTCSPLAATPLDSPRLHWWWGLNLIGIAIGIVFELSLLMYTALRSSVQVAQALGLRLVPLNKDRAFVAEMLVRAAFEMGDPGGEMLGINIEQEEERDAQNHKLQTFFSAVWYKGKAIITGVLLKQVCARWVTTYDVAMWIKPYFGTTLATILWDGMTCHSIMKAAKLRAIGVTTTIEVFNEIIDTFFPGYVANPALLSEKARLQLLRAIGIAIVKKGSMFPTMELLLRHSIGYLQMKRKSAIMTSGVLDNEENFIKDMEELSIEEARAVLCVLMLCFILDGSIGGKEAALWRTILTKVESTLGKVGGGSEQLTVHTMLAPRVVCQRFRNGQPITCNLLVACFDPGANSKLKFNTLKPHNFLSTENSPSNPFEDCVRNLFEKCA